MKYLSILILVLFVACSSEKKQPDTKTEKTTPKTTLTSKTKKHFKLDSPQRNATFTINDKVTFQITQLDSIDSDSIKISIDKSDKISFNQNELIWNSKDSRVGIIPFIIEVYYNDNQEYISGEIRLLSDIKPIERTYKIVKTYPHDINAFTQGLKYDNGFIYEGTGQYNESSLRKINLETGELIKSYSLPNDVFGEGITFYKDKIIQLTWKSWTGYVYDRKEFKMLYKFNYPVPIEGWGVEYNGEHLIVSDGTSNLMFFDPDSFTEIYRLQVYDNVGPVDQLNELEYVDGMLYANRYLTNKIIKIDPKTGKVLEEINMSGLLKDEDYHNRIDVLNGIAYDPEKKRFFVTGKYWPKLFHVEFI